jgi:enterochelin esterase-like enzyme
MKISRLALVCFGVLLSLGVSGYWYVFIAGAPQIDPPEAAKDTGLTFQVETFQSQSMLSVRNYGLVLPPGYDQHPKARYPVIILLHGGHGTERDFQDKALLTSVLHDLYRQEKLPPAIVITPDGNDRRGSSPFWDPQYYDGPNGKMGTLIGSELVQQVQSRYRTNNDPRLWAIGGLSSGGWGALNIGLRYTQHFTVMFSHSGYFTNNSDSRNSPLLFVQDLPIATQKQLRIYLDAGQQDGEFLTSTREFHQRLKQLGIAHQFHVFPGGHGIVGSDTGWNYWHKHLSDSLGYVGQQFQQRLVQPK